MNMTTKNRMPGIPIALFLSSTFLLSTYAKADTAATEATYKAKCAACHGADGKGKEALKTQDFASSAVQNMSDAELTAVITDGKGKMPAYAKSLKPDQVKDLVAFIRSFGKK
jgi:mono/diheme cytochrome c family protein